VSVKDSQMTNWSLIILTGAYGFVGASILRELTKKGFKVLGLGRNLHTSPIRIPTELRHLVLDTTIQQFCSRYKPPKGAKILLIHTASYGAYSWQTEPNHFSEAISDTLAILSWCTRHQVPLIHLGSSSEYGRKIEYASETHPSDEFLSPYDLYKFQQTEWLRFYTQKHKLEACNLRLFSLYGPLEHPLRLVPQAIKSLLTSQAFKISRQIAERDFVHIDDFLEALSFFISEYPKGFDGEPINICTGQATKISSIAEWLQNLNPRLAIEKIDSPLRLWDRPVWYGNPTKLLKLLGERWRPRSFWQGLQETLAFYQKAGQQALLEESQFAAWPKLSVIITCYNHGPSLKEWLPELRRILLPYPLIFEILVIDDCDPSLSYQSLIPLLPSIPELVIIRNQQNLGSQESLLRGIRLSTGQACLTMDGDGQDPVSSVGQMVQAWLDGHQYVQARSLFRQESLIILSLRHVFYSLWRISSWLPVTVMGADFCLVDKKLLQDLIHHPPCYFSWRSWRLSELGIPQKIIDYNRPPSTHTPSSNSLFKLLLWTLRFWSSTKSFIPHYLWFVSLVALGITVTPQKFYLLIITSSLILIVGLSFMYFEFFHRQKRKQQDYEKYDYVSTQGGSEITPVAPTNEAS